LRRALLGRVAVITVVALACSGCFFFPPGPGPGLPGAPVTIDAPAFGTQLTSVDEVPVQITMNDVRPRTLRVLFFTATDL
jgi:hypothetical protein